MKLLKASKNAITVLIVLVVVFLAGFFTAKMTTSSGEAVVNANEGAFDLKLPGEVQKRIVTIDEIESKLMEMAQLTTYSSEYFVEHQEKESRYMLDDIKIIGTENTITATAKGVAKVGIDVKDIVVKVDDDKIYIRLPEVRLNDNYIIWDSVTCVENNNILNPIEFSQYQRIIEELEAKGLKDAEEKKIYDKAESNVKTIINAFLSEFQDYEIVYM